MVSHKKSLEKVSTHILQKKNNEQLSNNLFSGPVIISNKITTIKLLEKDELYLSCCLMSKFARPTLFTAAECVELSALWPNHSLTFSDNYWTGITRNKE